MAIWSAMLGACPVVVGHGNSRAVAPRRSPLSAENTLGVALSPSSDLPIIYLTTLAAAQAGLHRGDQIVLIDGKPAASDHTIFERQLAGKTGTRATLATASPSGAVTRHVVTRDAREYLRSFAAVGLSPASYRFLSLGVRHIFSAPLPLGCAVIVTIKRSHDRLSPDAISWY